MAQVRAGKRWICAQSRPGDKGLSAPLGDWPPQAHQICESHGLDKRIAPLMMPTIE
ncbi:hypothetical protein SAMN05216359_11576 [Roseateles sp. YR242]|nr:hypothetical protein SAMN05216359_11576 [Roseateles sp. YR242]